MSPCQPCTSLDGDPPKKQKLQEFPSRHRLAGVPLNTSTFLRMSPALTSSFRGPLHAPQAGGGIEMQGEGPPSQIHTMLLRRVHETTPLPPSPLPLPSSGDAGSPAGSACCSLRRGARVNPKETPLNPKKTPEGEPASHPHAAPHLAPSRASSPARSVPAGPGTGSASPCPSAPAAAAEEPPKPLAASSESPARGRAPPQHIYCAPAAKLASSQAQRHTQLLAGPPGVISCHRGGDRGLQHACTLPKILSWVQGGPAAL